MLGRTPRQVVVVALAVVGSWLLPGPTVAAEAEVNKVDLSRLRVLDVAGDRHVLAANEKRTGSSLSRPIVPSRGSTYRN